MKSLVLTEPGNFAYRPAKEPGLTKDHAILKVKRIGICGTDFHAYEGVQPFFEYPRILGHEISGELVELDGAPGFKTGEQVSFIPYFHCGRCFACRTGKPNCCSHLKVCGVHQDGGMLEYLSVPSHSLIHGEGLSYDELALAEPLSIGAHGVRRAGVTEGEFILVVGAGPIGLGTMQFAAIAGGRVIALDINEARLRFCREKLKVEHTLDAAAPDVMQQLMEITNGDMPAVVIDATGNLKAINHSFQYMAHGARYVLIGLQKGEVSFSQPEFHKREATLMSGRNATRADFDQVIASMKKKETNAETFITHRVLFENVKEEFGYLSDPASAVVKAMIEMPE